MSGQLQSLKMLPAVLSLLTVADGKRKYSPTISCVTTMLSEAPSFSVESVGPKTRDNNQNSAFPVVKYNF